MEVGHEAWQGQTPHGCDVIMLVKQFMHQSDFSPRPLLVQPHMTASRLCARDLKVLPQSPLGERLRRGFRETANVLGATALELGEGASNNSYNFASEPMPDAKRKHIIL